MKLRELLQKLTRRPAASEDRGTPIYEVKAEYATPPGYGAAPPGRLPSQQDEGPRH